MKKEFIIFFFLFLNLYLFLNTSFGEEKILKMSTTTSTQASGLLDMLLPELEKYSGIKVKVIAKGTGAAIRDGMNGDVDLVFVHAKEREDAFVKDGYGTKRYAVMHNDFVILGPPSDPAKIKGFKDAGEALKKIASLGAFFVSRGDDSGTHTKEQALWKYTGLTLKERVTKVIKKRREREIRFLSPIASEKWYLSIGQGMGKALTFADEKRAYVLADRGSYIKYKFGKKTPIDLEVLCEGDSLLKNPYGVIPVNPDKHPHVRYKSAMQFVEWLISEKGQTLINNYKLLGNQLFYPDAM